MVESRFFALRAARNSLGFARLGLVASKRHNPLAVTRNTIKRASRECFRIHQGRLPSLDIVLSFWRVDVRANYRDLRASLWSEFEHLVKHHAHSGEPA